MGVCGMEEIKIGRGFAHGKIILMGEHAVVYGQPAIAFPFPATKMEVTVTETSGEPTIDCAFYSGVLAKMPELLESLRKVAELVLTDLNQQSAKLKIKIESSIPAERGMGSSAAVAVALTRALYNYFGRKLSKKKLLTIVAAAETIAHGNPSGLDALMTSEETPLYFIKGKEFCPLTLNLDAVLVVGDTGKTGQTKAAVASVAEKIRGSKAEYYQKNLDNIGDLVKRSRGFLEKNDAASLGKAMSEGQKLLKELDVSSYELDHLIETADSAGALGAKLTGGGRGGCMIALASDRKKAEEICLELTLAGARATWIYEMRGIS